MTIQQLRAAHQARPFKQFEIHLADGRSLAVNHPEILAILPPGRSIVVGLGDDTHEVVDLLLVTSLKVHNNGSRRRRTE
jgi:hypothetical protein